MFLFGRKKEVRQVLKIEGMMCDRCVMHVKEALAEIPGVTKASVSLKKGEAVISSESGIADDVLSKAVTEAGYALTEVR